MYYIMSEEDCKILEVCGDMDDDIIAHFADHFKCSVYAIQGQHSGFSAEYVGDGKDHAALDDGVCPRCEKPLDPGQIFCGDWMLKVVEQAMADWGQGLVESAEAEE